MPPLCRKKKVLERYNPDTYRVISQHAEETHPTFGYEEKNEPSEWRREWLQNAGLALPDIYNKKTEVLAHAAPDYRIHKPHPKSCGFLRNNVRLLNEPICSVYTELTKEEQHHWWPSRVSDEPLKVPDRTKDTIYREDFDQKQTSSAAFGSRRHTANPNTEPALGTVPVNFLKARDGQQRLFKEKISYEHQYNSRSDPNYSIRSKRHGTFVWDQLPPEKTKQFIERYGQYHVITPEQGVMRQEQMEAERLARKTAQLLESCPPYEPEVQEFSGDEKNKPTVLVKQDEPKEECSTTGNEVNKVVENVTDKK